MAIQWSQAQRQTISGILARFPLQSHRCEEAARQVLPVARKRDPVSHRVRIQPAGRARYVLPKVPLDGEWWQFHVTVEVEQHYVDTLTGADGTSTSAYFAEHWKYSDPEAYCLIPLDSMEPSP